MHRGPTIPPAPQRFRPGWAAVAILLGAALSGCNAPLSGADYERQGECSRQADREFNRQNRYQLSQEDQSSSPFSSSGLIGVPNKGLNDQYRRDRLIDDCLHATPEDTPAILPGRR